uniref:Uncharacterized protein n=1 Tax=Vespula pensylvanica TaxID=30213 RepID=A0A834PG75_VESPE|nr:hypothetical protein H0235_001495 [Vespula pensylvanica]
MSSMQEPVPPRMLEELREILAESYHAKCNLHDFPTKLKEEPTHKRFTVFDVSLGPDLSDRQWNVERGSRVTTRPGDITYPKKKSLRCFCLALMLGAILRRDDVILETRVVKHAAHVYGQDAIKELALCTPSSSCILLLLETVEEISLPYNDFAE